MRRPVRRRTPRTVGTLPGSLVPRLIGQDPVEHHRPVRLDMPGPQHQLSPRIEVFVAQLLATLTVSLPRIEHAKVGHGPPGVRAAGLDHPELSRVDLRWQARACYGALDRGDRLTGTRSLEKA